MKSKMCTHIIVRNGGSEKQQCSNFCCKNEKVCYVHLEKKECSICLNSIFRNDMVTKCGHVFHERCIKKWLENHTTCPLCRTQIPNKARIRLPPLDFEQIRYIITPSINNDSPPQIQILFQNS